VARTEAGVDIRFSTVFRNSEGVEIAGTWLDQECGEWAVSTVPLTRFSTEREAIEYFRKRCDLETGLPVENIRIIRIGNQGM